MLVIDSSPSTHPKHNHNYLQPDDFSTDVISLQNSDMTIESRIIQQDNDHHNHNHHHHHHLSFSHHHSHSNNSSLSHSQSHSQIQSQYHINSHNNSSSQNSLSVSHHHHNHHNHQQQQQQEQQLQEPDSPTLLRKKSSTASSIFRIHSNKTSKNQHQSQQSPSQQQQQQQTPSSPTSPNSSRPNLRSLLRIGSFSGNARRPSTASLRHIPNATIGETGEFEQIEEHQQQEEDDDDDEFAYLSDLESDLNFDPKAEESTNEYKNGGYHPVCKGEVYYSTKIANREYIILRKLGWGHFSTVWLAKSRYNSSLAELEPSTNPDTEEAYVALKFVKSNRNYMEAARDEIKIMNALSDPINKNDHILDEDKKFFGKNNKLHAGYSHVMQLLDDFEISGPHGLHICMVFEILGENLLNLIYKYKRLNRSLSTEYKRKESEEDIAQQMKFNKWDSKNWKKNTKSMLSLGLHSRRTSNHSEQHNHQHQQQQHSHHNQQGNNNTNPSAAGSTNSSSSSSSSTSPIELTAEQTEIESATTVDSWEDDLDKRLKSLNSESLAKLMETSKTYGGIPFSLVRQIAKQMLLSMDYIHHCGIIHTDLKPENVLIEIKDINKLISKFEDEKISRFRANSNSRRSSLFRRNLSKQQALSRHTSCHHVRTLSNSSQSYKMLKNSASDCGPIRCSKPITSISSDSIFKDFDFDSKGKKTTLKTISPRNFSFAGIGSISSNTSNTSNNGTSSNGITEISIKIADFGNSAWVDHHFTDNIQTRQYRSPEVILSQPWNSLADIWSVGCLIFELLTGDYLFDPRDGGSFNKDDDHLAQIQELLGEFPRKMITGSGSGTGKNYFNHHGELLRIRVLKPWDLKLVLIEKYRIEVNEAELITSFLLPMLEISPEKRASAGSLLDHPWLAL